MSECITFKANGVLRKSTDSTCDYVLMTYQEALELTNGIQNNLALYQFDTDLFEYILTQALVTFITGHVLGRVLKAFGKV